MADSLPAEALSVFDMLKIGVGPSSSHTLGPWRAVQRWLGELAEAGVEPAAVEVHLYGSLALTGRGHCTDQAVMLALLGYDPVTVPVDQIPELVADLARRQRVGVAGRTVPFDAHIPVPVFLGMHLLFTDPSTSPRTELGRFMFGVLYALSTVAFFVLLSSIGAPTFLRQAAPLAADEPRGPGHRPPGGFEAACRLGSGAAGPSVATAAQEPCLRRDLGRRLCHTAGGRRHRR